MNLISWNIQRGRGPDGTCSLDRVITDLHRIADADVVCLQEVAAGYTDMPGYDGSDQFAGLAERLPGYAAIAGLATDTLGDDGRRLQFGNMIFSRYPVQQVLRHSLPWPADANVMSMQRMALEVTLATPLGLVAVITTHLEYFSLRQRRAQVERLRNLYQEGQEHAGRRGPGGATAGPFASLPRASASLLAGDFNFEPGSEEWGRMQADLPDGLPGYHDAWCLLHGNAARPPTACVRQAVPLYYDYVFASAAIAPRVREMRVCTEVDGPDHQPLLISLS